MAKKVEKVMYMSDVKKADKEKPKAFIWKGKELKSMGETMAAAIACKTRAEAKTFMKFYREVTPHADDNIGYMSGYYDTQTAVRILDWFEVEHPVFGKRTDVPAEEAFKAGQELAQGIKKSHKQPPKGKSSVRSTAKPNK